MSKRFGINVGISPDSHRKSSIASKIAGKELQVFVSDAAEQVADEVISEFKSTPTAKARHTRRDNNKITA